MFTSHIVQISSKKQLMRFNTVVCTCALYVLAVGRRQGYGCPCTQNDDCRSGFCYRRSCADDDLQGVLAVQLSYSALRQLVLAAVNVYRHDSHSLYMNSIGLYMHDFIGSLSTCCKTNCSRNSEQVQVACKCSHITCVTPFLGVQLNSTQQ